jgi:hypothetical protein
VSEVAEANACDCSNVSCPDNGYSHLIIEFSSARTVSQDTPGAVLSSFLPRLMTARALRIFTWVWIVCVIVGSLLPGSAKNTIGTTDEVRMKAQYEVGGVAHRVWHFGVFGCTALLLLVQAKKLRGWVFAALGTFGLGLSLEILQWWIFGNAFEWWDVRDDAIGVLGAVLLCRLFLRFM